MGHDMSKPKSIIGEMYCFDRYGEALAYCVLCIRAVRFRHADNDRRRDEAHKSMLEAGWTEEELGKLKALALEHGTYAVEKMMDAARGNAADSERCPYIGLEMEVDENENA